MTANKAVIRQVGYYFFFVFALDDFGVSAGTFQSSIN